MILCGGSPGKRFALPNAKIMIHQGSAGTRGAPRGMEIHRREVMATTRRMAEIIAFHSGRPAGWRTSPGTAVRVALWASTPAARTPVPLQEARRVAHEARGSGGG